MNSKMYLRNLAIFMSFLIVILPIAFADTINLFYDKNGNVIQENIDGNPNVKREYNGLNQLVAVRNATNNNYIEKYTHHPLQERIWIKEMYNSSGDLSETVYYISKEFVRSVNASTGETKDYTYVWMGGQLIAQVNPDNTTYYVLGDNLGSVHVVTNGSGDVVENNTYNPAGDFIDGGDTTRYGYEGKEKSSVLGDIDFHFRKYDPRNKFYLQPDTLLENVYDPQLLNRYMFERGNPYKYIDPDGHMATPGWMKAQYWGERFNYYWGEVTSAWQQIPSARYVGNTVKAFVGNAYAVGDWAASEFVTSAFYTEEQLRAKREKAAYAIGEEAINLITSYYGKGTSSISRSYTIGTGGSLIQDAVGFFSQGFYSLSNTLNSLITTMRSMGSSSLIFGSGGGSGYVSGLGYVTSGGRVYPTSNPNWEPIGSGSDSGSSSGGSGGGGSGGRRSGCRATGNAACPS